jgi:cysteine-rich repeat protein
MQLGDGCRPDCTAEVCGDGIRDGAEACDDGNTTPGDGCRADCRGIEVCGDGLVDLGEFCDDGNTIDGDGCEGDCLSGDAALLYTVRASDDMLRYIDLSTFAMTDVGVLSSNFSFGGLEWDPGRDTLWMIDGRGVDGLHTVDRLSGASAQVGIHGINDLFGLGLDPNTGRLYGAQRGGQNLYELDPTSGAATLIGPAGTVMDGLTWDSTRGVMVALAAGTGDLYEIDLNTGLGTLLVDEAFVDNCGLAYDPSLDLFWALDYQGNLYSYDPNNGYSRSLVQSGYGTSYDGLAFITVSP